MQYKIKVFDESGNTISTYEIPRAEISTPTKAVPYNSLTENSYPLREGQEAYGSGGTFIYNESGKKWSLNYYPRFDLNINKHNPEGPHWNIDIILREILSDEIKHRLIFEHTLHIPENYTNIILSVYSGEEEIVRRTCHKPSAFRA